MGLKWLLLPQLRLAYSSQAMKLAIQKIVQDGQRIQIITLFRSVTMLCGPDIILQNISHIQSTQLRLAHSSQHMKHDVSKMVQDGQQIRIITLLKSITMLCGPDNILQNLTHIQSTQLHLAHSSQHMKHAVSKIVQDGQQNQIITLFTFITMICRTDNIMQNIPHIQYEQGNRGIFCIIS